jgi:L-alanine-DL-glutamate epimerase-like enolase superfamily enzyme
VALYERVAELPLLIDDVEFELNSLDVSPEFTRATTIVKLRGEGSPHGARVVGSGEDVTYDSQEHAPDRLARLDLAGSWTIDSLSRRLDEEDLFPGGEPSQAAYRDYRRWAFESAALDLALRQAGRSLHDVLGLEPQPVRFVNSLGLGKEPSIEPVRRRLARSPGVRFKLDAEATWAPALVDEVAATSAVDTIDFKGHYGLEVKDPEALGELYDRVLRAFPDAYLEDPHDLPEIAQRLGDHLERISYDAPIRSADDVGATPLAARVVNVKPSRIGSVRELF